MRFSIFGKLSFGLGLAKLQSYIVNIFGISLGLIFLVIPLVSLATPFTETVPNGNGAIPATYPRVGGTMVVLIGQNGNIYYQFVNPSTQFEGFQHTGTPVAFRGNPFQLGPTQVLNCGPTSCMTYFGGSIVEGYVRLTARDGDACVGNFDHNNVFFELNGFGVASFTGPLTQRTNLAGTVSNGFENCFRNQGSTETSTAWFDISGNAPLLNNILTVGSTTPRVRDTDPNDNFWFFKDGNDATGTPEVAPGISIVKTADKASYSTVGEVINYSFLVHNIGSVTLANVVITDTFVSGSVSCPQTVLVSNESMTCSASHTVTQSNIDDDIVFTNLASVTASPTEGTLGSVSGTVTIPGPPANNSMSLSKSPSIISNADVGDTITYTYVVTNNGNITLDNVNVTDAHFGSGSLSAITPASATLAPGDSQSYTATYVVTQADVDAQAPISNAATAHATPKRGTIVEPGSGAFVGVVSAFPSLTMVKSSPTANYSAVGDLLNYSYLVTNTGNVSLTSISVSDDVIDAVPDSVTCPALPVGGLAPLATTTCSAVYAVTQADLDSGSVTNTATASSGAAASIPSAVTINATQSPALTIDKKLNVASPTSYNAVGQTLLYDYVVTNSGNTTLTTAISVADDVVDGAGGSVSCPALGGGGLAPGNSITCTGSYAVTQLDINNGNITNTASATSGATTSPDDSVTVNAIQTPALTTTKTAQPIAPAAFVVGAVVTYDYAVQNTGNVTITTPITVSDSLIPVVTCDPLPVGGLLPTSTLACQGTYTVTANDVALGSVTNLATSTDGITTSPQTSETIPSGATPALSIVKTSPTVGFANVGDIVAFDFQITNTGTASFATDVTVIDNKVPSSPITCFTPTLVDPDFQPGEVVNCSANYPVTQPDLDAGFVTNEATANAVFALTTPVVSAPSTATVNAVNSPSLSVSKSASPSPFTAAGQTIVYTISVTNTGNQTLSNIAITDPLIPALSCTIASLPVTSTDNTCTGNYVVTQTDFEAGQILNTATASGSSPDGTPVTNTGNLTTPAGPASPSWILTKTSSSTPTAQGQIATYSFSLDNTGDVSISAISLTDAKCDAAPILTGGDFAPLGELSINEIWTYTCDHTVTQLEVDGGSIDNNAAANGTPARGVLILALASNSIPVASTPNISVTKTAVTTGLSSPVMPNDTINYTFTITNTGNVTLTNVTLSDPVANVVGAPIPSLVPGATETAFTASYNITQADIDAGTFSNQATAAGAPPTGPNVSDISDDPLDTTSDDDPTVVTLPASGALGVVKTAVLNDGGDGQMDVGDSLTYTYVVTNTGNVTIYDVDVAETPGAFTGTGILPVAVYQSGGADLDGNADDIDLAVGASATFTGFYTITQADLNSGSLTNQAVGSGEDPAGTTVSDNSDESGTGSADNDPTVTVIPSAGAIALVKTAVLNDGGDGEANAGDTITYTYVVSNTGNVDIDDITVLETAGSFTGTGTLPVPAYQSGGANLDGDGDALDIGVGSTITFTATYILTQPDINSGGVTNQAVAAGTDPIGDPINDNSDESGTGVGDNDPTTLALTPAPTIEIKKIADISALSSPVAVGDLINYSFEVTNTGNVTLTNVAVTDGGATVVNNPIASLAPGVTDSTTITATYAITQIDIDNGSYSNQALVTGNPPTGPPVTDNSDDPSDPTSDDDPTVVPIAKTPLLKLTKSLTTATQLFPLVYEIEYLVIAENTGNTTLTDVQVEDDLDAALTPGTLITVPTITATGFTGTFATNTAYDGKSDIALLSGNPELQSGVSATITIKVKVDFTKGLPTNGNTANGSSNEVPGPVPSDDPSVTPENNSDISPVPSPIVDADEDGAPDDKESDTKDRDGDGIADARDYDPTGYFYCEEDGNILSGGQISVTGPLGTQTGVGVSSNINIVSDGANGSYQFHVSAPGTYTLSYAFPTTGVASTDRLPGGALDVTSLLPDNPAVLGGGEIAATGILSDFTATGNPFYQVFQIEAGDPSVFNNNIPLKFCGTPELTANKSVPDDPIVLSNGNSQVTYLMSAENTGTVQVSDLSMEDNLNTAFGVGNHQITSLVVESAPAGSTASVNNIFNGAGDQNLLNANSNLQPGETLVLRLVVEVTVATSGTFTNTLAVGGKSPLDNSDIEGDTASVDVDLIAPNDVNLLQVTKTTTRAVARIGEVIPFTIRIENIDDFDRTNVDFVDFMPAGFVYRQGSAHIDGVQVNPVQNGRRLVWANQNVAANSTVVIVLNMGMGAAAFETEFTNMAWVEEPLTRDLISTIGKAKVRREIEHVFDCGEIIGKVFDDKNRDGYPSQNEPGLPGVRLATVKGILITTDKHGRYHVPCAAIPDARIGSNFILKLDKRTLPSGYQVTSENPRVVRLTRGKVTKLNFGASIHRVVKIDIDPSAFNRGKTARTQKLDKGIDQLIEALSQEKSVLRIRYHARGEGETLGRARLRTLTKQIMERWKNSGGNYELDIETRFVRGR